MKMLRVSILGNPTKDMKVGGIIGIFRLFDLPPANLRII